MREARHRRSACIHEVGTGVSYGLLSYTSKQAERSRLLLILRAHLRPERGPLRLVLVGGVVGQVVVHEDIEAVVRERADHIQEALVDAVIWQQLIADAVRRAVAGHGLQSANAMSGERKPPCCLFSLTCSMPWRSSSTGESHVLHPAPRLCMRKPLRCLMTSQA